MESSQKIVNILISTNEITLYNWYTYIIDKIIMLDFYDRILWKLSTQNIIYASVKYRLMSSKWGFFFNIRFEFKFIIVLLYIFFFYISLHIAASFQNLKVRFFYSTLNPGSSIWWIPLSKDCIIITGLFSDVKQALTNKLARNQKKR